MGRLSCNTVRCNLHLSYNFYCSLLHKFYFHMSSRWIDEQSFRIQLCLRALLLFSRVCVSTGSFSILFDHRLTAQISDYKTLLADCTSDTHDNAEILTSWPPFDLPNVHIIFW